MRLIDADALVKCVNKIFGLKPDARWSHGAVLNTIDAAPTIGEWISVEDKPPERVGCYQVYRPNFWGEYGGQNCVCYWDGKYWCDAYEGAGADGFELPPGDISHWMPLPEPPEDEIMPVLWKGGEM